MRLKINFQRIFKAIDASSGLAQGLERQDLEPKLTNVGRLLDEEDKKKKEDEDEDEKNA